MTTTARINAAEGTPAPSLGRLARLKLSEPVRLYAYSVLVVLAVGLNLAGVLTGEWLPYATSSAAVVLGVAGAAEAARASVYSPRSVVTAMLDLAAARRDRQ